MSITGSVTQNFNSLAISGSTNTFGISNWLSQRTSTGTNYSADAGSSTTGNLYSYGTGPATERALGSVGSGTAGNFAHGILLKNTSGTTISDIKVSYTLEQWRKSGVTAAQSIDFYYKISNSTILSLDPNSNSSWIKVTGLTLSSPINTATGTSLDGNLAANKVFALNVAIPTLNLNNNEFIMLKWEDPDHLGADHGLAIDDVTVSWTKGIIPNPQINVRAVIGSNPSISNGATVTSSLNNTLFSSVLVGGNQAKVFRIENKGTSPLTISSITFAGANPGDFAASPATLSIVAGSFQDFTVTFSPSVIGTRTTTISINSDDIFNTPYNFDLKGTGIIKPLIDINLVGNLVSIPDNSLFPSTLNDTAFGVATVGSTTVTKTFTIQNLGTTNLTLTGTPIVTISGTNASLFSVSTQPVSNTIAGGSSLTFSVIFNPTSLGSKKATINILSNDADETLYNFNINGIGKTTNNVYVTGNNNTVIKGATSTSTSNNTNFGGVLISTGVKQNTFVITNLSATSIQFSNVSITGTDAALFTVITNPSADVVLSGASTTITINFKPTSIGIKNAVATFSSNDPVDATFSFAISGSGENYVPCSLAIPTTIAFQDFEDIQVGDPVWLFDYVNTNGTVNIAGNNFSLPTNVPGYLDAKAFQFRAATTGTTATNVITLDGIDTSKFANIYMSMKVAALRTGSQGLDIDDYIQIETSVDNGVNWSAEAKLAGYNNSRWGFAATGVFDAIYSGANNSATADTRLGNAELAAGIATINLKMLPASTNLLIRITMVNDNIDEIWAIDNIKIEGQEPLFTTWGGFTWSNSPPTTSTKAIIDGNYNTGTNGNITTCECQVKAGKILNINTGTSAPSNPFIEIQGNIFNEGTINIDNTANLIQVNNSAINSGSGVTNVTRTTPNFDKFDYTYWSSPIKDDILGTRFAAWNLKQIYNFETSNYSDLFSGASYPQTTGTSDSFDDNGNDWVKIASPTTTTMTAGVGYAIMGDISGTFPRTETVTFSGEINNGIIPFALKQSENLSSSTDDYNLVGNPYPSSIKADDFIKANTLPLGSGNNITGTLYFWTHKGNLEIALTNPGPNTSNYNANDYATYNLTGSTGTASGSGSAKPDGFIGTGQGFFVEGENTNDLVFNNSMRNILHTNTQFFRGMNANSQQTKDRMWLNFENVDHMFSQQLIAYLPETSLGYDIGYDGLGNKSQNYVSFYSFLNNSESLAYKIQSRSSFDSNDQVKLGYSSAVSGTTSISIDKYEGIFANQNIYLQDNLLNITHDLKQAPYTFTTNYGTFNDRFVLKYVNNTLSNNTFLNAEIAVNVYVKDSKINIQSNTQNIKQIEVFDILGRSLINSKEINNKTFTTTTILVENQTLIVKIKLENGEIITKKILI